MAGLLLWRPVDWTSDSLGVIRLARFSFVISESKSCNRISLQGVLVFLGTLRDQGVIW